MEISHEDIQTQTLDETILSDAILIKDLKVEDTRSDTRENEDLTATLKD